MNSAARAEYILQELLSRGEVAVDALCAALGVDASTVRRDLEKLERQHLLRRVHGGAVRNDALASTAYADNLTFQENMTRQVAEKTRIAQAAARLIRPGDTIAISPGTTTTHLARAIRQIQPAGLTVVTNAANIALELAGARGLTLVLTGGILLPDFFALVGPMAEQNLSELHTDTAFIGMDGVSVAHGLTGPNPLEALAFRATMDRAGRTVVLADHTKIGRAALYRIAPISAMHTLITDAAAPAEELRLLREQGVAVDAV
jgi:DeoR/GlpR family transcriptional regulator of sugar metabolism